MIQRNVLFIGTGYMGEGIQRGIISKKVVTVENMKRRALYE